MPLIAFTIARLADAEEHFRDAMRLAAENASQGAYLSNAIMLGWLELRYRHRPAVALSDLKQALARFPLEKMSPEDRPWSTVAVMPLASSARPSRSIAAPSVRSPRSRVRSRPPSRVPAGWAFTGWNRGMG